MPGDAPVVVDSAGCGAAMKDYGRLLGTPAAQAFAARVRDFSEWVADRPRARRCATLDETLVVQDPCHLRHVQHAAGRGTARARARPTASRETADDGLCCGAGGAYSVREPELAGQIRDRKVAALRAAAGDARAPLVVVSANPGCAMHLGAAGLDVRHPAELLARALALDPVDTRSLPMRDAEHLVERLQSIEADLRDLAYDRLRAAAEDGDADALADEKKVLQARRAIERAIVALGGTAEYD